MQVYDNSSDKHVGETANNMVDQAHRFREPIEILYGDDIVIVEISDDGQTVMIRWSREVDFDQSVNALQTILETSADWQQGQAGL